MLTGNWWGVNNPYADEMNMYPLLKKLFCSQNTFEVIWINSFCVNGIDDFFNNIEFINKLAIETFGGHEDGISGITT